MSFLTRNAIPLVCLLVGMLIVVSGMRPAKYDTPFDIESFAELPVQAGGRILPIDSVVRNSLLIMRGRQTALLPDGETTSAIVWFMTMSFNPEAAEQMRVFRIDHDQVLGLFGWQQGDQKYFSFDELRPHFETIREQTSKINEQPELRTPYEKQLFKLYQALTLYYQLGGVLHPAQDLDTLPEQYAEWATIAIPGKQAADNYAADAPADWRVLAEYVRFAPRYEELANNAYFSIVPPRTAEQEEIHDWINVGEALLHTQETGEVDPVVLDYAELTVAWRQADPERFNAALASLHAQLDPHANLGKIAFEQFFNQFEPFLRAWILYIFVFILAALSFLVLPQSFQRAAFWVLILAFIVHTFGLLARMYIQDRPPVTNLYSSAIFVGWGAVVLGLILERIFRNGIGSFTSGLVGLLTLIIAHNLAKTGDTLEMMQAVLDSNFWLATHVVIITAGYSAMFLAGFLGVLYVNWRLCPGRLDKNGRTLYRMAYGITCFGLVFSFVGTMLGGIWADQSWGRFWGWDPKENGALMIVLWCALMLHARIGGVCRETGFMQLAIAGNIMTAWAWFGTNMLGIGLHSYGFMDKAFVWLMIFAGSQLVLIGLGFFAPSKPRPPIEA